MMRFFLQAVLALAAASHAVAARTAELEVLSARQAAPGNVVVAIAAQGMPVRAELALQLDNAPPVQAARVTPVPTPQVPLWLMLCLDRSGSVGAATLEGLKTGLRKALVEGRSAGLPFKVALMSFATRSAHPLDFTSDPVQVGAAIDRLAIETAAGGRSRMYDAIAGGIAALKAQGDGSKRLIVVSDGKDEGSTVSAAKLAGLAQGPPRIVIDALALGALAQDHSGALSTVAGGSGGRFLPSADLNDVARPLERLIAETAPPSRFEVGFAYAAAAGNRNAGSAALTYAPEGGSALRAPLLVALAAPESARAAPVAPIKVDTSSKFTFELVFDWLRNAPSLLAVLAAALLAAALGLWYRHKRARERDSHVVVQRHVEVEVSMPPPPPTARRVRCVTAVGHTWQAPAPGQPAALLRGISGSARGQMIPVEKALFNIGCDPNNDLVLVGDDFASGAHALLRFEAGGLYVEDLGSRNGSHLNGGMFKSATRALAPGDELRFGHTTFQLLAPQQAARTAGRSGFEPSPG